MSKIVALTAENVKKLKVVSIAPQGPITTICGQNESGKTSILDSIVYALGGERTIPPKPVRDGADKAQVVVELDNGLTITRTFTAGGNSYLKVVSRETGEVKSPQKILDQMYGKLTFDPLAFMLMEPAKQAETLRKLVNLDFSGLDAERKRCYDDRTRANRELDQMRAAVAGLPNYPDAPAKEVSSAEILAKIEAAQEYNQQQANLTAALNQANVNFLMAGSAVKQTESSILALEKQLAALRKQLDTQNAARATAEAAMQEAKAELDKFTPVDTTALKASLATCEETNRKVRANVQRAKSVELGQTKKREVESLTAKITAIDEQKAAALAATKFPVDGLGFADDVVTMSGIPLEQCSGAQRLRISVAIAAALNPQLRVMLVRDGSLLDEQNLAVLAEMATEMDIQVWLERVGVGSECSVILEDGVAVGGTCVVDDPKPMMPVAGVPTRKKKTQVTPHEVTRQDFVEQPLDTSIPPGADF